MTTPINVDLYGLTEYRAIERHTELRRPGSVGHEVAHTALRAMDAVATEAVRQAVHALEVETTRVQAHAEGRIAASEKREADALAARDKARDELADLKRTRVEEQRQANVGTDLGTEVKFTRADYTGWRLADLEDAAYRLRCAGGEDDTIVELEKFWIKAVVPDANSLVLGTPQAAAASTPEPAVTRKSWRQRTAAPAVGMSIGLAIVLVLQVVF